jgi:glycosyltransferase involved in cell wall biosynthesis
MNQPNPLNPFEVAQPSAFTAAPEQVLTIVMPAYNEADIIRAVISEWHAEVIARLPGSRLLVIDDCSTDSTAVALTQLSRALPGVDFLCREVNGGHGKALLFGFRHARSQFVFHTDSDGQHRPVDFWRLWELRQQYDFVFGVREKRQDSAFRQAVSTVMRVLNWLLWRVWISDANCPFKLMRGEALAVVLRRIPKDAFIPMVMVSILARRLRFRVTEVRVPHLARRNSLTARTRTLDPNRVALRASVGLAAISQAGRYLASGPARLLDCGPPWRGCEGTLGIA